MTDYKHWEKQYLNDPIFNTLIQTLENLIEQCQLTPYEIRQAAMYACMRHEERKLHPNYIYKVNKVK